ncbi:MAG: hypothetical protein CVU48_09495 [Candidatus Cloacimonetes bacterium HGW-Cloacimonetes-1]|jgi:SOS response regulatory protein OraA/RecX|nr:MAG: hypothetical protein CVU48_09495 [Candidatus Cloacimonetes bacterium HGW-Cloacimonetes-1]
MLLTIRTDRPQDRKAKISIDNTLWGTLPNGVLLSLYPIPSEQEIDAAEFERLKRLLTERAYSLLLDYLAKQERSTWQCRQNLHKHGFHSGIIAECITTATEARYLDDERFAELLARSLAERRKSRVYAVNKFYEHKIPPATYEPFLGQYFRPQEQREWLLPQIEKLQNRYQALSPYEARTKIIASLYRKGYSLELIQSCLAASELDD